MSNQLLRIYICCRRPVKEHQKLASKLCIDEKKTEATKASMRASETSEQTVHRREEDRNHKASMRASETSEQTVHRREEDRNHKASMRASETSEQTVHRREEDRNHKASMRVAFSIPDLKTVGSSQINLNQLSDQDEYDKVTIRAKVLRTGEPQKVGGGGKTKQEVLIGDHTATAITLWEGDVDMLNIHKSYQMSKLVVRSYMGKQHLSYPPTGSTIEELDDLED